MNEKTIIIILFIFLLIINRKETFQNYLIFDNDRKRFLYEIYRLYFNRQKNLTILSIKTI